MRRPWLSCLSCWSKPGRERRGDGSVGKGATRWPRSEGRLPADWREEGLEEGRRAAGTWVTAMERWGAMVRVRLVAVGRLEKGVTADAPRAQHFILPHMDTELPRTVARRTSCTY